MSTDIAVHFLKSNCKFKQNDKKKKYSFVSVLNYLGVVGWCDGAGKTSSTGAS